jgi:glutamate synthase (NADPH/NADH) small chain
MPADVWNFLRIPRVDPPRRPVAERLRDWRVVVEPLPAVEVERQAARCMDCGIPFCQAACPLGNSIPDWNALTSRSRWRDAIEVLHATNNFPEFTGWLCPAPCEPACVLDIDQDAVSIKQIERTVIEAAWENGWVRPHRPARRTTKRVAVVGSGPAGLAAAQQLTRAGHGVTVFERSDRPGGLLRYGIPDFKMDKALIDRRLGQMMSEGTTFETDVEIGRDRSARSLKIEFDACVLACGSPTPRDVDVPGRDLDGIVWAMDFLEGANRAHAERPPPIDARGKRVVVIGGGDTAADCLGTANRQGATEVVLLDHNPQPPWSRDARANPWPQVPHVRPCSPAHEEGVVEGWALSVEEFIGDERHQVRGIRAQRVELRTENGHRVFEAVTGREMDIECELVLIAAGFAGAERAAWLDELGVDLGPAVPTVLVDECYATAAEGVFACGDMARGASLVVWAIAEGRACAASVDATLEGHTLLPAPIRPSDRPL